MKKSDFTELSEMEKPFVTLEDCKIDNPYPSIYHAHYKLLMGSLHSTGVVEPIKGRGFTIEEAIDHVQRQVDGIYYRIKESKKSLCIYLSKMLLKNDENHIVDLDKGFRP